MGSSGEDNSSRYIVIAIVVMLVLGWVLSSGACSTHPSKSNASSSSSSANFSNTSTSATRLSGSTALSEADYADIRWPTHSAELLALPESVRYYNAYRYIDQTHTIVGPVANVYQATSSAGMPIFVDLGVDEMPSDWFTFVIWAEDLDPDLERMLNAVDHDGGWLEITGYIYLYDGRLQTQTGHGPFEYRWWTSVK